MTGPRVDRRLAAVFAADVVGYTRLMHSDEDGTLSRLKHLRQELIEPQVAEHRGRVVKLMGDGILCVFGSAIDAVACAFAIQHGMAEREAGVPAELRLQLRIGVNLGDIVHEADGDIYGDGVNLAARLEGLAEPGCICVSQPVQQQLRGKLDLTLEPMGAHRVKNVAEPIQVWRLAPGGDVLERRPIGARLRPRRGVGVAATLLLVLALGSAWWSWWPLREPPINPVTQASPGKPSIAVLPFDNLSHDARLDRLADGVVEDVIAALSRFRDISVVARTSTFAYRGRIADVRRIGGELGARYVLAGSVRSSAGHLRLATELIDTATGTYVRSDAYDRGLAELDSVQSDVAEQISASVGGMRGAFRQTAASLARSRPANDRDSYDLVLLGTEQLSRHSRNEHPQAMELIRRAFDLDPSYQPAHVALALGHWDEVDHGWAEWPRAMDAWLTEAQQAVALDPGDAMAHVILAVRLLYGSDFQGAAAELTAARDANHNDAFVLALIAGYSNWLEISHRPLDLLERAVRLDPSNAGTLPMVMPVHYFAHDYEGAISKFTSRRNLGFLDFLYLAMSYGQMRRTNEALAASDLMLKANPWFSAEWGLTHNGPFAPAANANRALYLDGVEKAGLPPCATWEQLARGVEIIPLPECDAMRAMTLHGFSPIAPDRRQRRNCPAGTQAPSLP